MISRAVIPVAGLGTRLLSVTKEQPKEMLPVFARDAYGGVCIRPIVELIFEQLYEVGVREFYFVVGRGKRAIEDHFTPDNGFLDHLKSKGKGAQASSLESFYEKIRSSTIIWLNQPEPLGFGHAVLMYKPLAASSPFIVYAGDTYIISESNSHLARMINVYENTRAEAVLLLQEIEDPRQYGVAEVSETMSGPLIVKRVEEKPERPATNLAIMPVYIFEPIILKALETIPKGVGGELQLTDGIQRLIDWGLKVVAVKLEDNETRLDIGTPDTYWEALAASYRWSKGMDY